MSKINEKTSKKIARAVNAELKIEIDMLLGDRANELHDAILSRLDCSGDESAEYFDEVIHQTCAKLKKMRSVLKK